MALPADVDAVIIGAGHHGLVAANLLVDAGWTVAVLERSSAPGGAVRTEELTAPGYRNDVFSAFYPLAAGSPVIRGLGLEDHGLRWCQAPAVLAHPRIEAPAALLARSVTDTAAALDADRPGDGDAWTALAQEWARLSTPLLDALLSPLPPIVPTARLGVAAGAGVVDLLRRAVVPVRRFTEERFGGEAAPLLLAGCALHTDLTPEAAGSALYGWLLAMLGQEVGFPVPEGGAGALVDALVARLRSRGGELAVDADVRRVVVRSGRAVGVELADGTSVSARRAVLADVSAPALFTRLLDHADVPARVMARLGRFQWDSATVKVDWALDRPIPWADPRVGSAGTVHLAPSYDELALSAAQLAAGWVPAAPFVLLGQMAVADPTRAPAGGESAWAYVHLPQQPRGDAADGVARPAPPAAFTDRLVERVEAAVEAAAPGFGARVVARHVLGPDDMEARDPNLVNGAVNGGTAQLHQQLVFRPLPGSGRPETGVAGLFLASAAAHPGGGVHGACGANAARAALVHDRARRATRAVGAAVAQINRRVRPDGSAG